MSLSQSDSRAVMGRVLLLFLLLSSLHAERTHSNALIDEASPYLRQHAHNPVDWYPWGEKAFRKARHEKKLIFLSIGYSTCHWCHVMEKESFEDEAVARLLNRDYVAIKVDRESYPQIDQKYQRLFRRVHRRGGGWPLSLFLTPDLKPFYITTYIPREDGYGSEGLLTLLPRFADYFHRKPEKIAEAAALYAAAGERRAAGAGVHVGRSSDTVRELSRKILRHFSDHYDTRYGGFSERPKFPGVSRIRLLIRLYRVGGEKQALEMLRHTLTEMAKGGIYDQVEGGFFRYTTDRRWQIPHFEKMLYTNAGLIAAYAEFYRIDPDPLYRSVVEETIAEMDHRFLKGGLYLSASDADSDGEEGGYYTCSYAELKPALRSRGMGEKEIDEALAYLGIEEDGNIDGEVSQPHIASKKLPAKLDEVKAYLRELRRKRHFPFVDGKSITAWNAMMIEALFLAGGIDERYGREGERRMQVLLSELSRGSILYHQKIGRRDPDQPALLEDYAALVNALIAAYEFTFDQKYLKRAAEFAEKATALFYRDGIWYLSSDIVKTPAEGDDGLYASPLGSMLSGLLSLAILTENLALEALVGRTLRGQGAVSEQSSLSASKLMEVYLRWRVGDLLIGSGRDRLRRERKRIEEIDYPFILLRAGKGEGFSACKLRKCFAGSSTVEGLAGSIKAEKQAVVNGSDRSWRESLSPKISSDSKNRERGEDGSEL